MQREHMINYDGSKIEFGTESYEEGSEEVGEETFSFEGTDEDPAIS